jgi:hypothetical protein
MVNDRLWLAQVAEDERGLPNVLAFSSARAGASTIGSLST